MLHSHPVSFKERTAMSDFDATKNGKPSKQELNEEQLEKAVGGGGKKAVSSKTSDEGPQESLTINFTKIMFTPSPLQ
jgi:hypothetical protein